MAASPRMFEVLLALFCVLAASFPAVAAEPGAAPPRRLALLVGVARYPKLGPAEQLDGCANDVEAMRQLLLERYGFAASDVVVLVDQQATGESIRRAMEHLASAVQRQPRDAPPARVVFHFSGHGSQILDQPAGHPDRDEVDGLDETLVPSDASKQGGSEDIRDDELFRFAEAVCLNGRARLWGILDCCHSGTGARGATRVRKLDRSLGPVPLPGDATAVAAKRLPSGAAFLSACRDREVEPEYQQGGKSYGLLTRFLVQVLNEPQTGSRLSLELLRQAILASYRQDPAIVQPPLPQLEGDAALLRSTVLESSGSMPSPYSRVQTIGGSRSTVLLLSGAFHGVTRGSLYEIFQRPEQIVLPGEPGNAKAASVAWVRVEQVEGATATATVFRWEGEQQADGDLPGEFKQGFAVERHHEHGEYGCRVRVVAAIDAMRDGPPLGPEDAGVPAAVRQALRGAQQPQESAWLRWVQGSEPCDLLLRIDGRHAALFPATGRSQAPASIATTRGDVPRSLVGGWGPVALDNPGAAAEQLANYLRRITRARNLIRLSATQANQASGPGSPQVKLELMEVQTRDGEIVDSRPWKPDADGALVMRDKSQYALRVTNPEASGAPLYVTILHIDGDMGIDQVLPFQEGAELHGDQRLEPGAVRMADPFECCGGENESKIFGPRWAIALATREPNDFYMLTQPSLPKVRSTRGAARSNNSLNELLLQQTYFATRGGGKRLRPQKLYDQSWSAATAAWTAVP